MDKPVFLKLFKDFNEGTNELGQLSYSVKSSLGGGIDNSGYFDENEAISTLARNAISDKDCKLIIGEHYAQYTTSGGLQYGWRRDSPYFYGTYLFYVRHPSAPDESAAPEESTLRESANEYGWIESNMGDQMDAEGLWRKAM